MYTDICKKNPHIFMLQSLYFLRYVVETESQKKGTLSAKGTRVNLILGLRVFGFRELRIRVPGSG